MTAIVNHIRDKRSAEHMKELLENAVNERTQEIAIPAAAIVPPQPEEPKPTEVKVEETKEESIDINEVSKEENEESSSEENTEETPEEKSNEPTPEESKVRFCDQCGAKITSANAKFCAECGNKLF